MPPKRQRCSMYDGNKQCKKLGEGNPPICDDHYEAMEEEEEDAEDPVEHAVNVVTSHPQVQGLFAYIAAGVDRIAHTVDGISRGEWPRGRGRSSVDPDEPSQRRQHDGNNPGRQPPPQPPPRRQAPPKEDPRVIFGFPAGEVLTREKIKKRHRDLAKILHSDKGGSDESMKRLNAARDQLLAQVKA